MAACFQYKECAELVGSRRNSWGWYGSGICSHHTQWRNLPRVGDIFHFGTGARGKKSRGLCGWTPSADFFRPCDICLLAFLWPKKRLGRAYGVSRIVHGGCRLPSRLGMVLAGGPSVDPFSLARSQRKSGPSHGNRDFHCLFGGAGISASRACATL